MNLLLSFKGKAPLYLEGLIVNFFNASGTRIATLNEEVVINERVIFTLPESSEIVKIEVKTTDSNTANHTLIVESSLDSKQWNVVEEFNLYLSNDVAELIFNKPHTSLEAIALQDAFDFAINAKEQEKNYIADVKLKAKLGRSLSLNDVLSLFLSSKNESDKGIQVINNGGGYKELRDAKLTDTEALKALAIYNVKVDSERYESEIALQAINNDPSLLTKFANHLSRSTPPLKLPPLDEYLTTIRSTPDVYSEARVWVAKGMK